ncbi:hypothetical protein BC828DRAFT_375407 [Blastocladiella britannica]|nr:hypothetical protein BC828DRAFT_375407 [Blastocladiella britannica]
MSATEPPISDAVAVNSLIATGFLLAYSLTALYRSIANAFPIIRSRIAQIFQGKTITPKSRKRTPRDWLLITSAMLLIIDTFNKFAMLGQYRATGTANYLVYRIFEIMALHSAMFLIFFAIALRCTIIVLAKSPSLRKKIIGAFALSLAIVFSEQKVAYFVILAQKMEQGANDRWWIQAKITPLWLTLQVIIIILAITGVSTWSVYIAFHDPTQLRSRASQSSSQKGSSAPEKSTEPSPSESSNNNNSGPSLQSAASQARKSGIQSAATIPVTATASMAAMTMAASPPMSRVTATATGTTASSPVSSLQQNLTLTFTLLSFVVVACYIVHLIIVLLVEDQLPMIQGLWVNFVLNTILSTELLFDALLRWSARRQK